MPAFYAQHLRRRVCSSEWASVKRNDRSHKLHVRNVASDRNERLATNDKATRSLQDANVDAMFDMYKLGTDETEGL